jgi:hypothetical protein
MSKNKRKRAQAPKDRNQEFAMATITRHAAAARKPRLATDYRRKPKHVNKGWE